MKYEQDDLIDALVRAAAAVAPAVEQDVAATALGLTPDRTVVLVADVFKRRRELAGLKTSEIAAALKKRGWSVTSSDVLRWQTEDTSDVAPVLLRALAAVLMCETRELTAPAPALNSERESLLLADLGFQRLVDRVRAAIVSTREHAQALLLTKYRGLAFRGGVADTDHAVEALGLFVTQLESEGRL